MLHGKKNPATRNGANWVVVGNIGDVRKRAGPKGKEPREEEKDGAGPEVQNNQREI